jgi:tyrosinase
MAEETAGGSEKYDLRGIPISADLPDKTKNIPYVPGMPARINIEALASEKKYRDQWTLFVLALERFKAKSVGEKLSYFRVAGIHLAPYQPWDGASTPSKDKSDGHAVGGYCFHNALNFPTFHRPYMLLFEKLIWENMTDIVADWSNLWQISSEEAEKWFATADAWRLPYWDWAARQSYVDDFACPEILTLPTVRIFPPDSISDHYPQRYKYPNPFWSFENPEQDEEHNPLPFGKMPAGLENYNLTENRGRPWNLTSATSRHGLFSEKRGITQLRSPSDPYKFHGLKGVNNVWQVNSVFSAKNEADEFYDPRPEDKPGKKNRDGPFESPGTLADAVSRMLSDGYHSTYEQFSTTKWWDSKEALVSTGYLSLEYIHNNIHDFTGGSDWESGIGTMADVTVAAFDPVFWLHHCNVDRLFAIWQALNWDKWWNGSKSGEHPDEQDSDDRKSALEPFHFKDGHRKMGTYKSDDCRDWTHLCYTYDDLDKAVVAGVLNWDGKLDEKRYIAALRKNLKNLYPSSPHAVKAILESGIKTPDGLDKVGDHPEAIAWQDYIINVTYDRYALNGDAYSIEFYIGGDEDDPKSIWTPANHVGKVFTFSGAQLTACPNCTTQQQDGILSRAQVPLTIHLLRHATSSAPGRNLDSFIRGSVETYLASKLHWRYIQFGGQEISADQFPKTEIEVLHGQGEVVPKSDDEAPDVEDPLAAKYHGYSSLLKFSNVKHAGGSVE